ncbi:MAG: hypothetical protein AAFU61_05475 [Pseudomonadota bacterium]
MRTLRVLAAATLACVLGTAVVEAATAAFGFKGGRNGIGFMKAGSDGGLSATVSAMAFRVTADGERSVEARKIARSKRGWGVVGRADKRRMGTRDARKSGGDLVREAIRFDFSRDIHAVSGLVFEHKGRRESFEILDENNRRIGDIIRVNGGGRKSTAQRFFQVAIEAPTSSIIIRHRNKRGSGIRIRRLVVQTMPLPGGAFGLISALALAAGARGLMRRRRVRTPGPAKGVRCGETALFRWPARTACPSLR